MEILKILGIATLASLAVASVGAFFIDKALDALERLRQRFMESHNIHIAG